jgi:hypothetical protein
MLRNLNKSVALNNNMNINSLLQSQSGTPKPILVGDIMQKRQR